ncbi:MAG: hypothetical protein ACRELB_25665 [Polyangiaceae bacterium]
MHLDQLLGEYALGWHGDTGLRRLACAMIDAGYRSRSLARLSCVGRDCSRGRKRALFERALRELHLRMPAPLSAAFMLRQRYAQLVVDGVLHPDEGAQDLVRLNRAYCRHAGDRYPSSRQGDAFGVGLIVKLFYDAERVDVAELPRIYEEMRQACVKLASGEHANVELTTPTLSTWENISNMLARHRGEPPACC